MNVSRVQEGGIVFNVTLAIRTPYGVTENELKRAVVNELPRVKIIHENVDISDKLFLDSIEVEEDCTEEGVFDDWEDKN